MVVPSGEFLPSARAIFFVEAVDVAILWMTGERSDRSSWFIAIN